jgi:hypothetical protein
MSLALFAADIQPPTATIIIFSQDLWSSFLPYVIIYLLVVSELTISHGLIFTGFTTCSVRNILPLAAQDGDRR